MLRTRVIPALLLRNESLVKTIRFNKFCYVGDPCNTVRIFNELEVDELVFLDITATSEGRSPNLTLLKDIATECFMPLAYGGGVKTIQDAKSIFEIGFEKVAINTEAVVNPMLIRELSDYFGSQSVIVSIDVKKNLMGKYQVRTQSGRFNTKRDPVEWAKQVENLGAGEILLTSIDKEGTWSGFDIGLVQSVSNAVNIPVIAHGGAASVDDIGEVVNEGKASAVALGSMVTFQKQGMGVLINFPDKTALYRSLP